MSGRKRPRHRPEPSRPPQDRLETPSILTCGNGLPLAITLSAAYVNDHLVLPELLDKVPPLRGRPTTPTDHHPDGGQGLRLPPRPRRTAATRHHQSHPAPQYPQQSHRPVGRRTIPRPAPSIPTSVDPLNWVVAPRPRPRTSSRPAQRDHRRTDRTAEDTRIQTWTIIRTRFLSSISTYLTKRTRAQPAAQP